MEPETRAQLDVLLLLDDTRELAGKDGVETFIAVSEVVEALEASLARLGHRCRRLSFDLGVMPVIQRLAAEPPDVIFPLGQPEPLDPESEWYVTGLLELLKLPHTSESAETLVLACDKVRAKALFAHQGIASPAYAVSAQGELPSALPPPPWIAKPGREDGSVGIPCVAPAVTREQLADRVRALHQRFAQPILIETFASGREFQVGVVGGELLPFIEIDFSGLPPDLPRVAGYESKWKYESAEFKGLHFRCPAQLTPEFDAQVRTLTQKVVRAFGLSRCARLDLRVDDAGVVNVLDVNPNPDLSPVATLHAMADQAGWGFDGLVTRMLSSARQGARGKSR